jgi:hypothetical protein
MHDSGERSENIALLAPWRGAKSDEGAGNGMMIWALHYE